MEYCFAVPANRIGNAVYSPAELKTIQEVIMLVGLPAFTGGLFQGAAQSDPSMIALGALWHFGAKDEAADVGSSVIGGGFEEGRAPGGESRPEAARD